MGYKKSKIIEIEIVELDKKGNGIGFAGLAENKEIPVEVPFGLPKDLIKASVLKHRRKHIGKLQEIVKPSPLRQAPKCYHFGDCGGCRFQNISYADQLKIKEDGVKSLFKNMVPDSIMRPIIPSENVFEYRNKMEFTFSENANGQKYLGLIKSLGKGKVVTLNECHLVTPWFIDTLKSVRDWWVQTDVRAYSGVTSTGALRTLTLREGVRSGDRMAILTVSGEPEYALNTSQRQSLVEALNKAMDSESGSDPKSIFLRIQQSARGVETNFFEIHLQGAAHIRETLTVELGKDEPPQTFRFHISPAAFFQPNTRQAERLYGEALQLAGLTGETILYDLYCGTGTLGIIAAKKVKKVVGVEISPESIQDANMNAEINGIENITFVTGAVKNVLSQIQESKSLPSPDIVVVDPPRPGLHTDVMRALIELNPSKILYISCNPETQAENVQYLIEHGYKVAAVQPIDQFPHTPHVENIVLLEKF